MTLLKVASFTNTFLIPSNGGGLPELKVVGPEDGRKKRPHRKSRRGCIRCKKRKVKCDENEPCGNCVKRKETCLRRITTSPNRLEDRSQMSTPSPQREESWCPLSEPECGPINMLHMELLHHFERFTIPTLSFEKLWPHMLQLAFQSRQHTYLVNAMLSLAAAHLDYLVPENPVYRRAKYALLDKALHDYRLTLSRPITAENCDALLGTANIIQFLMWCDLSFMEDQSGTQRQHQPLDLSSDRLYLLSTGVRQIFFMAWPLFQTTQSLFMRVGVLGPCMALEDVVEARGLNWQRFLRAFMDLYDNSRYHGGPNAFVGSESPCPSSQRSQSPASPFPPAASALSSGSNSRSNAYLDGIVSSLPSSNAPPFKVTTLWQSFKEGEEYIRSAGTHDEALARAAYKRIAARLAIAMAFVLDHTSSGCPASRATWNSTTGSREPPLRASDTVRYVATFPMMCFGPPLALISSGDSRILVVLFHIYRVVRILLPGEQYWWCRRRVKVMEEAIGRELRSRGLEVCLRRKDEVL